MASNQLSAIVHRTDKTQSVLLTTLTLSTCHRTVHFRSTPLYLPDAFTDTFSLNVQHHDFWTQHLRVVYKPSLNRVCGRPATIFYTALKRTINYSPFVTHCLDAKETKNQGQPDRSACLSGHRHHNASLNSKVSKVGNSDLLLL